MKNYDLYPEFSNIPTDIIRQSIEAMRTARDQLLAVERALHPDLRMQWVPAAYDLDTCVKVLEIYLDRREKSHGEA